MPVRSLDQLKSYFRAGNKPSQRWWDNFFDSMSEVERQALIAYEINGPIIYATNQAHRLSIGAAITIGRMVQDLDTGVTYVKQQAPGSNSGDWEAIGDAQITIPDVAGLQAELDNIYLKDADSAGNFLIGAANFYQPGDVTTLTPVDLGATARVDMNLGAGNAMAYASVTKNFTIAVNLSPGPTSGLTQTVLVLNNSAGGIEFSLPADSALVWWVLINGVEPIVVAAGKMLTLAVQSVPVSANDPDYGGAGHVVHFITYGLQT